MLYLFNINKYLGIHNQSWLDLATLEQALFERLMLENPLDNLVTDPKAKSLNHSQTIETQEKMSKMATIESPQN